VLTDVRSDCGQRWTGPSAVADQFSCRMRAAISLVPGKVESSNDESAARRTTRLAARVFRLMRVRKPSRMLSRPATQGNTGFT
jgi:hypothetical protein